MKSKTIVIFGVFDGIHDGHRAFIREARTKGDRLVAVVARDSEALKLKGKLPTHNEAARIEALLHLEDIDAAFLGDLQQGAYNIIKEIKPDIILLGYDQQALFDNLKKAMQIGLLPKIQLQYGTPYKPDVFHTSILNKADEPRN